MEVINISNVFCDSVTDEYKSIFAGARIYGTIEDPYFVAKDIEKLLGLDLDYKNFRDHDSPFQEGVDITMIEINTPGGKQKALAFTETGLYSALFKSDTQIADEFQTFVMVVLRRLRLAGRVTKQEAINDYKKQLEKYESMAKNYALQYEREKKELAGYVERTNHMKNTAKAFNNAAKKIEKRINYMNTKDPTKIQSRYESLVQRYMKPIYVYTVNAPKEHKIEFEDYDKDETPVCEDEVFPLGLFNSEQDKGQLVGIIYIHQPEYKISDIKKILHDTLKVPCKSNTFITTFQEIKNKIDSVMLKKLKEF